MELLRIHYQQMNLILKKKIVYWEGGMQREKVMADGHIHLME